MFIKFTKLFRKQFQQQLPRLSKKKDDPIKRSLRVAKRETPTRSVVSVFDLHKEESDEIGTDHDFTLWEESVDM